MAKLTGVVPPVITPLTEAGEVDADSLVRLLDFLIEGGVSGLFILGSTSEVAYLTDEQRAVVLETTVKHVAGRLPVLAGVIDMTTPRVLVHARQAQALGADAIVVTAPFYTRVAEVEIERHYRLVAAAIDLPVYAYDIPVCVHSKLSPDMVIRLGIDGVIAGIKDSSGDDSSLRAILIARSRDPRLKEFSILTGSELVVDNVLGMGADGVVPGLGNVDPEGYVRLYRLMHEGRFDEARAEQERLYELFRIVSAAKPGRMGPNSSAIGGFKAALELRGVIAHHTAAAPQIPLDEDEIAVIAGLLVEAGLPVLAAAKV